MCTISYTYYTILCVLHKIYKQKGPTGQHRDIYSAPRNIPYGKEYMCVCVCHIYIYDIIVLLYSRN